MTTPATQTQGQDAAVVQAKVGELISLIYKTIPYVDVAPDEDEISLSLDPKLYAQDINLDTLLLVTWSAMGERAERQKLDMGKPETLLGRKHQKLLIRKLLHILYNKARKVPSYQVQVRLPAGDPLYDSFIGWVPTALKQVLAEDIVSGGKVLPYKLTFKPVGRQPTKPGVLPKGRTPGGHSQRIVDAILADLKALPAPSKST